jgi:hypothetical protein
MRKHALLATVFAVFALLVSCSAVFDAGIGGKVYYIQNGSEVGISGAKILVYDDTSFSEPIGSARTDANGNYSVSKIVWKTKDPKFGKTADNHTVYVKVTHEDFEMKDAYITARIVSDSTNIGMADVEMTKTRYTVPVFSGRIIAVDDADKDSPSTEYDGVPVYLAYKNSDDQYIKFTNDEAVTYTTSVQVGTDYNPYYIHGTFAGLGGGNMKYPVADYPQVYVLAKDKVAGPYPIDGVSSYQIYENDFN